MLTEFGKFCRKLRIDEEESLRGMATKLNVTPSYLSQVENGKRRLPVKWGRLLVEYYELKTQRKNELGKIILMETLSEREKHALYEVLTVLQTNNNTEHINGLWRVASSLLGEKIVESENFILNEWLELLDHLKN